MIKSWKKISVALLMAIGGAGATAAGMSHNAHASTTPTPTTSQNQNQNQQSGTDVDNVHVNQHVANNLAQANQMQQEIMNNVKHSNSINNANNEIQFINNQNRDNHGNIVNGQNIANAGNLRNLGTHFVHLNLNYIQPKAKLSTPAPAPKAQAPQIDHDGVSFAGDPSANTTMKGNNGSQGHADAPKGFHYVNGSTGNFTFNNSNHTFNVNKDTPATDTDTISYTGDPSANTTMKGTNGSQGHANAPQGFHYVKGSTGNFTFNNGNHTFNVNKNVKPLLIREAKAYHQVQNNVFDNYNNKGQVLHSNHNGFDQLAKLRARQIAQNFVSPSANTNYKRVQTEAERMGFFTPRDNARVIEVVGTGNFKGNTFHAPAFVQNVGKYGKRVHSKKQYVAFGDYYSPKLGRYVIDGVFANKAPRELSARAYINSQNRLSKYAHEQKQDYYKGDNLDKYLKYFSSHHTKKAPKAKATTNRTKKSNKVSTKGVKAPKKTTRTKSTKKARIGAKRTTHKVSKAKYNHRK